MVLVFQMFLENAFARCKPKSNLYTAYLICKIEKKHLIQSTGILSKTIQFNVNLIILQAFED